MANRAAKPEPPRTSTTAQATHATAYAAWPEGNDMPSVSTCAPGGRGRSYAALAMSTASHVSRNAITSAPASRKRRREAAQSAVNATSRPTTGNEPSAVTQTATSLSRSE